MADQDKEKTAIDASKAWLKLVDEGKYSKSWDEAAQYFKNAIPREQWKTSLESVRSPLGKVQSINLKSKNYTRLSPVLRMVNTLLFNMRHLFKINSMQ